MTSRNYLGIPSASALARNAITLHRTAQCVPHTWMAKNAAQDRSALLDQRLQHARLRRRLFLDGSRMRLSLCGDRGWRGDLRVRTARYDRRGAFQCRGEPGCEFVVDRAATLLRQSSLSPDTDLLQR